MKGGTENEFLHQVTLVSVALHDQNGHLIPCFDCLDLGDAKVPQMMPSAPCDAETGTNGIT